jgi:hypothetical protein
MATQTIEHLSEHGLCPVGDLPRPQLSTDDRDVRDGGDSTNHRHDADGDDDEYQETLLELTGERLPSSRLPCLKKSFKGEENHFQFAVLAEG